MVLLTAACANTGNANQPIPTRTVLAGSEPGTVLVVVLPGRWDNAEVMADAGMAEAIQSVWPQADVLLTSATLAYYMDGQLPQRLKDQIFDPARRVGYERIWLVGASMGGMGALLFEDEYPGRADGLVLLAPYLGRGRTLREIQRAGGLAGWTPGPEPSMRDRSNFDREVWRLIHSWMTDHEQARRVWVGVGDSDRLRAPVGMLAEALPDGHVVQRQGGHAWVVWVELVRDALTRAAADMDRPPPAPGTQPAH